jgi:DNA-directed RNA polymerase specialized sigma24 family protein
VPASRRSVVIKHDLEGLDVIDIARELSLTKFGVYARLYKGRKELASAVRRLHREGSRR